MFRKPMAVLLVLVILLSMPFGSALAQGGEDAPVYCGDLSADDCAILEQSELAMLEVASSAVSIQMDMDMVGMEDPDDAFSMSFLMDGVFAADPEILANFEGAPDPEAMTEMMSEGLAALVELLRGVQGEVSLEIVLPAELAAEAGMPMDTLATELVMVDGVLYANLESLIPVEAGDEMQMPAWMGLDLAGMYEMVGDMPMEEFGGEIEDMQELFTSEELAGLYDYTAWEDFIIISRLEDEELMGQTMAVFNIVLDYEAMFADDAFEEAFTAYIDKLLELQGVDGEELPDNFVDVVQAMVAGMSVEINQWIGLDDYYLHHFDLDFAFDLDSEAIAAVEPKAADDMPENFSMSMSMVIDSSAFNEPVEVEAPEGAQVINPMMFMDMPSEDKAS